MRLHKDLKRVSSLLLADWGSRLQQRQRSRPRQKPRAKLRHAAAKKKRPLANFFSKRLAQGLSCVIIFLVAVYASIWCLDPAHFPVSAVRFIGERNYLSQEVLRTVAFSEIKTGFFRLKVENLKQQLLLLPWMKHVDVRKVWPNQLVIHFEEHKPAAIWGNRGVISATGTLFYPSDKNKNLKELLPGLPVLEGPEGKSGLVWQRYLVMKEILAPLELQVAQLVLAPRGAWHLRLSNGIRVVLGTDDSVARLQRFARAYEKKLALFHQQIAYVDLRYTSGMSVGWKAS